MLALIREMSTANLWGAPRIHGELLKLGIAVSQSTVAKYMRRHLRPPSQTWRTFLTNHASQIRAADLFVVPSVTFRLLFRTRDPLDGDFFIGSATGCTETCLRASRLSRHPPETATGVARAGSHLALMDLTRRRAAQIA